MNTMQISNALMSDKKVIELFVGIFPADMLPKKEYPGFYIANTQPASGTGEHWVAFYTPCQGRIEAFDSFGQNPATYSEHIKTWMGTDFVIMSGVRLQGHISTTCGQYCMFFVLLRSHGHKYEDIMSALTRNPDVNDRFVCKFINKYFSLKTTTHNDEFLMQTLLKGIKELTL
jgi:hypothetical protein